MYFYILQETSKGPESAVFVPESAVFPTYDLEVSRFFRNFAKTMEVFLRVWAAAQQSSSELGSAFALHHPCTCKRVTHNAPIAFTSIYSRPPPVTLFSLFFTTTYNTRSLTYSPLSSPEGDTIPFEAIVTHPTVGADPCVCPNNSEQNRHTWRADTGVCPYTRG